VWLSHSELKINPNFTGKVLTNLIQFHSHISFKAAVLNYIGSQLVSKKDREELGRLFKSLDTKGHGSLDKEEVQAAYK
jgi:Ca2+-binding EF-hand superfamily protein